jgi:hypothetical protein
MQTHGAIVPLRKHASIPGPEDTKCGVLYLHSVEDVQHSTSYPKVNGRCCESQRLVGGCRQSGLYELGLD